MAITGTSTAGNDFITSDGAPDLLLGLGGDDTLIGGDGNDTLDGGTGVDLMIGGLGDDAFSVDNGLDEVIEGAGEGSDRITSTASYTLSAGTSVELLIAAAGAGNINLIGNELAQVINGNEGNNLLDAGNDALAENLNGGLGNDTYRVRAGDIANETAGEGTDLVFVYDGVASYTLAAGSSVETLSALNQGGTAALDLTGNNQAQSIFGNNGANVISSGIANAPAAGDTLVGLGGADTYRVFNTGDVVTEVAGGGADTVVVASTVASYTLAAGSDVELLASGDANGLQSDTGVTAQNLTGNALAQQIAGNDANNILSGGGGTDTFSGYAGNDIYIIDSLDDVIVVANEDGGTDVVSTSASYQLATGLQVERLIASRPGNDQSDAAITAAFGTTAFATFNTNTTNINLVGNEVAQVLIGNDGNNIILGANAAGAGVSDSMYGLGGNDTYRVYNAGDLVVELDGQGTDVIFTSVNYDLIASDAAASAADGVGLTLVTQVEVLSAADQFAVNGLTLTGNTVSQNIYGDWGNNVITGGGGTDTMTGFRGNDLYNVDSNGDAIIENAGEGYDVVVSTAATYQINGTTYVEEMRAGAGAVTLIGNELSMLILGNGAANTLNSGGGAPDTMIGGTGDDTYVIHNSADVVSDGRVDDPTTLFDETITAGGTADTALTFVSYALATGSGIDNLYAANQGGTAALNLAGNDLANRIIGNSGDNLIDGGAGAAGDTMIGLGGNDTYRVRSTTDVVTEVGGDGTDAVFTSVSYTLTAGSSIEVFSTDTQGSTAALNLTGNALAQSIFGNAGVNQLDGKEGNDTLTGFGGADQFRFSTALGATNVDTITDFTVGTDKIGLNAIGVGTPFEKVSGGTSTGLDASEFTIGTTSANDATRIIYDPTTGNLFYDADGTGAGAQVLFAVLSPGLSLTSADFITF